MRRVKFKYFPFSPGIPWKVRRNKYVLPEIDLEFWQPLVSDKEIVITCFGKTLENFFALAFAEMLLKIGHKNVTWKGMGWELYRMQGLIEESESKIESGHLDDYPVPLFFDKENRVYMNVMYNYINYKSLYGYYPLENNNPLLKQLGDNMLVPWDFSYLPKIRKTKEYNINKKFILIFPDHEDTMHEVEFFDWSLQNIREFVALVKPLGYDVLIYTKHEFKYHGIDIKLINDLYIVFYLLNRVSFVLSSTIDWLLIAIMMGGAKIAGHHFDGKYDLHKNIEYLGLNNVIFTSEAWISPFEIYTHLRQA
ncbi:MAG: hypothetical protein HC877_22470 [Thioploca sp.]|nr:hypothetical protein [Thioploca sp.]